jgi:hypothetical protein
MTTRTLGVEALVTRKRDGPKLGVPRAPVQRRLVFQVDVAPKGGEEMPEVRRVCHDRNVVLRTAGEPFQEVDPTIDAVLIGFALLCPVNIVLLRKPKCVVIDRVAR